MKSSPPHQHIAAAKTRLAHLAELSARTEATERRILAAAEERLATVAADLDSLRPRVTLDDNAARAYQDLTLERGRLEMVIAQSRRALGL